MDIASLKSLELPELKQVAAKHGIKLHHKAGAEKVLQAIIDHVSNAQPVKTKADEQQPVKAKPAPKLLNQSDVEQALAKQLERDAFKVVFHGDDTFTISCNGAEESLHMTSPVAVIKRRAESVARGAFRPRMIKLDGELVMSA